MTFVLVTVERSWGHTYVLSTRRDMRWSSLSFTFLSLELAVSMREREREKRSCRRAVSSSIISTMHSFSYLQRRVHVVVVVEEMREEKRKERKENERPFSVVKISNHHLASLFLSPSPSSSSPSSPLSLSLARPYTHTHCTFYHY